MKANRILPVDIVLDPEWWNKNTGITFDRDFFFHPLKRVECEQKMEKALYERWGKYGLGVDKDSARPEIGAVHLAAGFLLPEILGCKVEYSEKHPPTVHCNNREELKVDVEGVFKTKAYKDFEALCDALKVKIVLTIPKTTKKNLPAVVCIAGYGGDRYTLLASSR